VGLGCLAINLVATFALMRQAVKDIVSVGCFFASLLV